MAIPKLIIPKRIETERLVMRPHIADDVGPFTQFMTDLSATRYLDFDDSQRTEQGARELLDYVIASYDTPDPVFALAIVDKDTGSYMGSCGLSPLHNEDGVQCYYSLLPKYWGWGFATEAMMALLYYCFTRLDIEKVIADMSVENPRAWKVAKNIGMRDEGARRMSVENPSDGTALPPARRFSITSREYEALD